MARTTTPSVTSRRVPATVVAASFWKRVTERILAAQGAVERPRVGCRRAPPPAAPAARSRAALGVLVVALLAACTARRGRAGGRASASPPSSAAIPGRSSVHAAAHLVGERRRPEPVPVRDPRRRRDEAAHRPVDEGPGGVPGRRLDAGDDPANHGAVHLGDPRRARGLRRRCRLPERRRLDGPRQRLRRLDPERDGRRAVPGVGQGLRGPGRRQGPGRRRRRPPRRRPTSPGSRPTRRRTRRFYTTSVDEALAEHKPFVLVFATPRFCTSKQCGPTLDGIKAVAKGEPGMTFINVEPYQLEYAERRAAAGARREQPAPDHRHHPGLGDPVGAVGLRGRQGRDRPRLVRDGRLSRRS